MPSFFRMIVSSLLMFSFLTSPTWSISEEEVQTRVEQLSNDLRCPTCQGLSVKESEAGFSVQMKNTIRELVQKGYSDEAVKAHFVERYGEWILRAPPKEGFNLILWIFPGIAMILALLVILRKSRKWVIPQTSQAELPPLTEEERQILETDLKRFNRS